MTRRPLCLHRLALAAACAAAVPGGPLRAEEKVTFIDNALPVLRQRCGSCHNADKKTAGLDVTSYAGIMAGGGSGEVIVPGDAKASYLFRVANHDDEPKMPPDAPPIPEPERQVLRAWIDGGVLENKGSVAAVAKKVDVAMAAPTGERPAVQPLPAHLPLEPVLRTPALDACAVMATSPWAPLAAVCGQKQVLLYRTDSLALAGVLPFPEGRPHVVRFSAGGGLVLAGGGVGAASGRVAVWSLKNGRRIRTLGDELDVVLAADISPDQRLVALGGPQKVARIWSLETGQKLHDLTKHTDWITAAAFSPDGVLLATADRAGGVIIWEAATGRDFLALQSHPASVTSLAWRGDSNLLATACDDGQIRLWELENGAQVKAWGAHGGVAALEFTRDGRLVSTGRDKVPKLWKADGTEERSFEAGADMGLAASYCDETNRLIAGDWTGEIRVWNAADGARVGTLDANPVALADRVAAADREVAARQAKLAEGTQAVTAAATELAAASQERAAALAAKTAADGPLAETQKQVDAATAAVAAVKQSHAEAAAALPVIDQQIAAAGAEVQAATAAVGAAGEDATAKEAANQALVAAQAKLAEAQGRREPQKAELDKRAAAIMQAEQQVVAATGPRDQAKIVADVAGQKLAQTDAAVAAATTKHQQAAAQADALKAQLDQAAAAHAHWLAEVVFQSNYVGLATALAEREQVLGQAEADLAQTEARRQADEQAQQAVVAKKDGMQKQIASLTAAIAQGEQAMQALTGQIEKRGGELIVAQGAIEKSLQAIAAIDASTKSLDTGLAAAPDDATLKQARAGLGAALDAKRAQLKQEQDGLAALMAEKAAWEKAIVDMRAAGDKHKADIAALTAALPVVDAELATAAKALADAVQASMEKRAVVTAKQAEVDAAGKQLDALQGIQG
jgi:hypothetical protein